MRSTFVKEDEVSNGMASEKGIPLSQQMKVFRIMILNPMVVNKRKVLDWVDFNLDPKLRMQN